MNKNRKDEIDKLTETIIEKNMIEVMSDRFGRYSKYIIQQRAIPDSRDGLKPVQRRILFSMWNLKLKNNQPFKKSARIVGDVIGRYHPHGDSSIYEALVRMCQEWKSNFPLIEMHGNRGSIDDDPAAAMRYTESRLEKISELLLQDLERKTVPMAPNFDDTEYEPVVLPSLIPNLLINGSKGIAAGFATEIPPHNLIEIIDATIKLIKKPTTTIEELEEIVKGPDFPTGGIIYGLDGIKEALETGQGKINIAAKYEFVYDKKDNKNIIGININEIPFGVIKSKLVADMDALVIDKTINGIKEVRDQSDREGISIYIELEEDANAEAIINYMMSKTDLRIAYNYNMVAIHENAPKLMNLYMLLIAYLSHFKNVNTKGIEYDLEKYKLRLEIVEGFIKVADISDEVIKVIKNSDNSKKGVIESLERIFGFTNLQATAIAELRLYKLSRMDQLQYKQEAEELKEKIAECTLLLTDPKAFDKYMIKALENIKKEYGKPRVSLISEEKIKTQIDTKLLAKNEDFYFFISKEGYFKKISKKAFNANDFSGYKLKENDAIFYFNEVNSLSKLAFFTNLGNYFILEAHTLKDSNWKDLGYHISSIVALENKEEIVRIIELESFKNYANLILITKKGMAKRIEFDELNNKQNQRKKSCIPLQKNDNLCDVKIVNREKWILVLLHGGIYYFIDEKQIPLYSLKATGIHLIKVDKDQEIIQFVPTSIEDKIIMLTNQGQFKSIMAKEIKPASRQSRGKILFMPSKSIHSEVISIEVVTKELKCYYTNENNEPIEFDLNTIPLSKQLEPLTNVRIKNFNNAGTLIQPIKVKELFDMSKDERNKIRENKIDNDDTKTVETTLFKRKYNRDDSHYEKSHSNDLDSSIELFSAKSEDDVDIDLTLSDESALDIGKLFTKQKPNNNPITKESVDKKISEMEKIDIDSLFEKVKEIKKK
ncbi:DNA topoisomerase (ATP-hydrolyzing) [Metamycoplasma buccale]|uniref:DNA topoisomerase (ATP-hydrolyzing) n=1 Tax=Metamycoplasma buccale TaxID=55602 RepID=UPI00398E5AF5